MKKIAFVVQRYGKEVNGGAETLCRELAEHLSAVDLHIDVLTTCAVDYYSWKNEYKKGEEHLNGVKVRRFKSDKERDMRQFNELSGRAFADKENTTLGEQWMKAQGPYSSDLFKYIEEHQNDYDAFVFFTYLYATTYFGTKRVHDKKKIILVPTAHDETPIYLSVFDEVFSRAGGFIFNTKEEEEFSQKRFHISHTPSIIAGMGVTFPEGFSPYAESFKTAYHLSDYVIYAGRIDEPKGCKDMFRMWAEYKLAYPSDLKLVLMGKAEIDIPKRDDILSLGFISEEEKYNGIAGAKCMLIPSAFESFSIVLLESFLCNVPVLVNEKSEVLKGHCLRSNGGLWYGTDEEFAEGLQYILAHENIRKRLGENGNAYVKKEYAWPTVLERIKAFIAARTHLLIAKTESSVP